MTCGLRPYFLEVEPDRGAEGPRLLEPLPGATSVHVRQALVLARRPHQVAGLIAGRHRH
jgi:hypothetical protein